MNWHGLGRASRLLESDRGWLIVPNLGPAGSELNGDRRRRVFLEGRAQVLAVDLRDRAGTTQIDRHLPVARPDPITQNVPAVVYFPMRTWFQAFAHSGSPPAPALAG
jgi:hypothetical protein